MQSRTRCDIFLTRLSAHIDSKKSLAGKEKLYLIKSRPYKTRLRKILEMTYLKSEQLMFLLVVFCSTRSDWEGFSGALVDHVFTLSPELAKMDQEKGFQLYCSSAPEIRFISQSFKEHMVKIISETARSANYYCSAASHLVKCMSITSG